MRVRAPGEYPRIYIVGAYSFLGILKCVFSSPRVSDSIYCRTILLGYFLDTETRALVLGGISRQYILSGPTLGILKCAFESRPTAIACLDVRMDVFGSCVRPYSPALTDIPKQLVA
jgi:hypothetical protein